MTSPKRIAFVLALISAISVTVICVSNFNSNSVTASGVKVVRVLRRKDKKQDKPAAAVPEIPVLSLQWNTWTVWTITGSISCLMMVATRGTTTTMKRTLAVTTNTDGAQTEEKPLAIARRAAFR